MFHHEGNSWGQDKWIFQHFWILMISFKVNQNSRLANTDNSFKCCSFFTIFKSNGQQCFKLPENQISFSRQDYKQWQLNSRISVISLRIEQSCYGLVYLVERNEILPLIVIYARYILGSRLTCSFFDLVQILWGTKLVIK